MRVFDRVDRPNKPELAMNPSLVCPGFSPLPPQAGALMIKHGLQGVRIPRMMETVGMRQDQLSQSLQCKEVGDLTKADTRAFGMITRGRYFGSRPQLGNQRNDPPGLASTWNHPTNTPLFPKASNFFAGLPTRLGQPK